MRPAAYAVTDESGPVAGFADVRRQSAPAWVFHNISLATQEMRALHDIAQTLGTRLSVNDTMALLTAEAQSARCRARAGSCFCTTAPKTCFGAGSRPAWRLTLVAFDDSRSVTARAGGRRVIGPPVLNARAGRRLRSGRLRDIGRPFQSALSYPLVDGDELIGTLTVYHAEREPFREEHRHVLDHVSRQVASVLRNAVAFERMRDVVVHGSADRTAQLARARRVLSTAASPTRPATPVPSALIMIDLDDFKAVNDGHGHQIGDAALQAVATRHSRTCARSDFCARYGGDEFVAVLTGCDRAEGGVAGHGSCKAPSAGWRWPRTAARCASASASESPCSLRKRQRFQR